MTMSASDRGYDSALLAKIDAYAAAAMQLLSSAEASCQGLASQVERRQGKLSAYALADLVAEAGIALDEIRLMIASRRQPANVQ